MCNLKISKMKTNIVIGKIIKAKTMDNPCTKVKIQIAKQEKRLNL